MSGSAAIVSSYMQKAERALEESRLLLKDQRTEGACSRAYYAMHDAAHAALFATGHEAPDAIIKTHHGLIAEFGKRLVLGGQIDAAFGRAFSKAHDIRLLADYSAEPPSLDDARWSLEQAEIFVAAIRGMFEVSKK
jgi:uncharacterized protein (UPF0332 family)